MGTTRCFRSEQNPPATPGLHSRYWAAWHAGRKAEAVASTAVAQFIAAPGIISPVISTSLYFVVFGAAIGSRIKEIDGISYCACVK
jgi:hypothetical protein